MVQSSRLRFCQRKSLMRFFLSILSFLILFQPISWAVGAPMYGHEPMDDESALPVMLMSAAIGEHCQNIGHTDASSTLTDTNEQQDSQLATSCVSVTTSAVSSLTVVATPVEPQYLFVVYPTTNISFHSHIESPEIRPPHNIRS